MNYVLICILFLLIFGPVVRTPIGSLDIQLITSCVVVLIWLFMPGKKLIMSGSILKYYIILGVLFLYALITTSVISDIVDWRAVLRPIRALIVLFSTGAFCLLIRYSWKKGTYRKNALFNVVPLIVFIIFCHSIIMILQYLDSGFKAFIYSYTVDLERVIGARINYSMAGLTNGGGAQLSVYQSVGVILSAISYHYSNSLYQKLVCISFAVICFLSVLLTGRSGILAIIIFLPFTLLLFKSARDGFNGFIAGNLGLICVSIITVVSSLVFIVNAESLLSADSVLLDVLSRSEAVFDSSSSGIYYILFTDHIIWPADSLTWMFGDTYNFGFSQGSADRLVQSDIGYIRILFGYGLVGSAIHYIFYVFLIKDSIVSISMQKQIYTATAIIVLSSIILLFNMKEVFVFTRIGFTITCILLYDMYLSKVGRR